MHQPMVVCTTRDVLLKTCDAALPLQQEDGSFPAGRNGPWNCQDTPLRVTAHWAISLLRAFELTAEERYRTAATQAIVWLCRPQCRPGSYAFHCCRSEDKRVACNNLIGQAWVTESLLHASDVLHWSAPLDISQSVLMGLPFDEVSGLWGSMGVDGDDLGVCMTLNQQIWLTVMAERLAGITGSPEILRRCRMFVTALPRHLVFNGRTIDIELSSNHLLAHGRWFKYFGKRLKRRMLSGRYADLTIGYCAFTLCGLAHLYLVRPDLELWEEPSLRHAISQSLRYHDAYLFRAPSQPDGFLFAYNPTGLEIAYSKETFKDLLDTGARPCEAWIEEQMSRHLNPEDHLMGRNTIDPHTLSARMYELTYLRQTYVLRIPNSELERMPGAWGRLTEGASSRQAASRI